MKGGARIRSGPVADVHALRRDQPSDAAGWTNLPAAGREGPTPVWPLAIYRSKSVAAREAVVWEREWRRPQALMWERFGLEEEVALYVRSLVHAERPRSATVTAGDRTLVRQLMDDLGISVSGLQRHRWRIAEQVLEETSEPTSAETETAETARDRFRLVAGGQA